MAWNVADRPREGNDASSPGSLGQSLAKPTRTISEIVERLRQFRCQSNDLLAKHTRRLDWVRAHFDAVPSKLGLPQSVDRVHAILVTNTRMPMQYAQGVPLPPGTLFRRTTFCRCSRARPVSCKIADARRSLGDGPVARQTSREVGQRPSA